jgi:thiosulfate reductase cytochrome b subunit
MKLGIKGVQTHSIFVRVPHWLMAIATLVMIGSGWQIYNASPIFGFRFPDWATLGGTVETALAQHNDSGLASALLWHFAGMWLLVLAWVLLVAWGVFSGHFRREFLPVGPTVLWRDFRVAARFRLPRVLGEYNAVEKAFYWAVLAAMLGIIVSGIAIWKPVQTYPLELLFGGFEGARIFHFLMMAGIVGFLLVHVALAVLAPRTLVAMIVGQAVDPEIHS